MGSGLAIKHFQKINKLGSSIKNLAHFQMHTERLPTITPYTYPYSTTGWCEPLRDDIGFPEKLFLLDSLLK